MQIILLALILFSSSFAIAKDFGIQGHTFPIIEENILKVIEAKLQKIDLEKLNKELQDKTEKYVENPPSVKGITKAKENKTFYFDPSYTVPQDIYDHLGILIAAKGTRINPLEHTALVQPLIFIDGDDKEQVELAVRLSSQGQDKIKIILVKGFPLKLQRAHKKWIYFDQAGVLTSNLQSQGTATDSLGRYVQNQYVIF